jgi:putative DNA primase/helicase
VNRTAENPLDVDVLANVCLDLTVDEVRRWTEPSAAIEMVVAGIVLTSAVDMARCWPEVWPNERAAKWTLENLKRFTAPLGGSQGPENVRRFSIRFTAPLTSFRYQVPGARLKPRIGFYDPTIVPDPRKWLEARLGPLALFEELGNP